MSTMNDAGPNQGTGDVFGSTIEPLFDAAMKRLHQVSQPMADGDWLRKHGLEELEEVRAQVQSFVAPLVNALPDGFDGPGSTFPLFARDDLSRDMVMRRLLIGIAFLGAAADAYALAEGPFGRAADTLFGAKLRKLAENDRSKARFNTPAAWRQNRQQLGDGLVHQSVESLRAAARISKYGPQPDDE